MTLSSMTARAIRGSKALWAKQRDVARTTRELELSSDRALGEMGLARGDIPAVANGTFRRG